MPIADDNKSLASKSLFSTAGNESSIDDSNTSPTEDVNHQRRSGGYRAPEVAKDEERDVKRAKILIATVLVLTAIIIALGIYKVSLIQDNQNMENLVGEKHIYFCVDLICIIDHGQTKGIIMFCIGNSLCVSLLNIVRRLCV